MNHQPVLRGPYKRARADWLDLLHQLTARGLSDREVAVELSRRFAPLSWTRRVVWWWRTAPLRLERDALSAPGRFAAADLELSHWRSRQHQIATGWGHLLPGRGPAWPGRGAPRVPVPGVELRRTECAILSLLRDRGPLSARQVCSALGFARARPVCHSTDRLARLRAAGLVAPLRAGARPLVYALTPRALAP